MNLRLRDYRGDGPGWSRTLSRATLETAGVAAIIAYFSMGLRQTLPSAQIIGLGAAAILVAVLVGPSNKRRSWSDVLTGTQYEPTAF